MLRRQRRSTSRSEIEAIVAAQVAWWPLLDEAEQQRLLDLSADMVARVRWEAANGFTMSDEIPVLIAVQASLLLLGLDDDRALDNVGTVIVHRSTVTQRGERSVGGGVLTRDPMALSGQAHHRGPVLISWNAARRSLRRPGLGENVVLHE
ncbi:MAG: zinc-dependent peptidase, partial [Actinomycetota bacterium]|nr:zinc-dependent peptidase [Actinomycetota bacterium]